MSKPMKSGPEIKALVVEEFRKTVADADVDAAMLIVSSAWPNWLVTFRRNSGRLDEAQHAAIFEISRRLAAEYDCSDGVR